MNKYLAQLADLQWLKVVGIGIAIVIAYYFLMFNDGTDLNTQIKAAQERREDAKKQLALTEKAMENANRFEKEVEATAKQFERIVEFMPPNIGAAELTAIINKQAQASGVKPRISPKGEEPQKDFYQVSRVELELEGTFPQILMFLSNISRVPKLLTFDEVEVKTPTDARSNVLTFKGTLLAYRYKNTPVASANKPGTPPTAPAPAAAAKSAGE